MIDFKYHMVSLVAVFLALAVGIVLGAGPLRGELSDTLESQVAELGQERNELRARVDLQQERAEQKDELLDALVPGAVEGTLTGQSIRVVELPGSEADVADAMATALVRAGAERVTRTAVLDAWEDPRSEAERQTAAEDLLAAFPGEIAGTEPTPANLLATVLAGPTSNEVSQPWRGALAALVDLDVIETSEPGDETDVLLPGGSPTSAHDVVVIVTGGIDASDVGDNRDAQLMVDQRLSLVLALTRADVPTLVVGTGTESFESEPIDAEDPLILAIRTNGEVSDVVSTVDNAESSAGQLAATWASAWLSAGENGDYGLGADAQAPAPDPPPSALGTGTPQPPGPTVDPGAGQSE